MSEDPTSYNAPRADALTPDKLDDIGRAILSLTREICVLTDRQVVLETLLEDAGVVIAEALETYQPDKDVQARIDARTSAIVQSVIGELKGE